MKWFEFFCMRSKTRVFMFTLSSYFYTLDEICIQIHFRQIIKNRHQEILKLKTMKIQNIRFNLLQFAVYLKKGTPYPPSMYIFYIFFSLIPSPSIFLLLQGKEIVHQKRNKSICRVSQLAKISNLFLDWYRSLNKEKGVII